MAKKLTSAKAKKILHDKSVHGKPLTDKQRKFFGAVASGVIKAQNGIEGTMGGLTDQGFDYNGAWGGTMQTGGSLPGSVGFMYARTQSPAPSNGPYAKKTKPSAQNGMEMKYWQEGLDFKPKTISKNGSWLEKYQDGGPVTGMAPEVVITGKKPKSGKKLIEFTTQDISPIFESEEKEWLEKEVRPAIYDQWQYMKDYVNSPAYKDRLKKLYNTEVKYRGDRAEEIIGEVKEDESPFLKFNERAKKKWVNKNVKDTIKYANAELEGLRDEKINIRFGSHYPNMPEEAYYEKAGDFLKDPIGNVDLKASFLKNRDIGGLKTGPLHELSHATTLGFDPYSDEVVKDYVSKIFDNPMNTEQGFYVQRPTETKARIDAIRYLAYKKGIYDPTSGDITDAQLEKLMSDKEITKDFNYKQIQDQLKKEHKKGGLKWLLNNIAKLQPLETENAPLAQTGTVIEDSLGQWAHPGQITKIPSNEITMQGVNYPVLGISDTGDVQMMQPGQDYTFDGNSVTEIPMMQKGGAVKDPGYSEPDYVTGTSRRAINKMIGMGNYLIPGNVLNQAADLAELKGYGYGEDSSGPLDAVRHASAAASTAARLPIPKLITEYSPALDRAMRIAATNALGLGYELRNFNLDGALMDLKNNYQGSLVGSIPGLSDKERNRMIVNQLTNKQLTVDNPKRKKENGGWLSKYE